MAYVITDTCIHPKTDEAGFEAATQMYVDPEGCIDCGACVPACTSDSIHALEGSAGGQEGIHREKSRIFRKVIRSRLNASPGVECPNEMS